MTTAARQVLEDCKAVLAWLRSEPEGRQWRIAWVAAVSLLRATGHVLEKIDKEQNDFINQAICSAWKRWKNNESVHAVFWEFKKDRDLLLKEYKFRAHVKTTVCTTPAHLVFIGHGLDGLDDPINEQRIMQQRDQSEVNPEDFVHLEYVITEGKFKGRDQRDVVQDAIDWWEHELDLIDEEAARLRK